MATENYYKDVKHIVYISTNSTNPEKFADSVNDYIKNHGYKLLHVGQDAKITGKGNPVSDTIAVLGK